MICLLERSATTAQENHLETGLWSVTFWKQQCFSAASNYLPTYLSLNDHFPGISWFLLGSLNLWDNWHRLFSPAECPSSHSAMKEHSALTATNGPTSSLLYPPLDS